MQSFDSEIKSLIFPGNKTTDQNQFDNCEEYEHPNQIVAETFLIRLILGDICISKTAINADVSTSEKLRSAILSNQGSNHPGFLPVFAHLITLFL